VEGGEDEGVEVGGCGEGDVKVGVRWRGGRRLGTGRRVREGAWFVVNEGLGDGVGGWGVGGLRAWCGGRRNKK